MFRFSIRDVLWLTVVVGLGVGWWADNSRIRHERDNIRQERDKSQLTFAILTTHLEMLGYKIKVVSDPLGDDQLDVQRPDGGALIRIPDTR